MIDQTKIIVVSDDVSVAGTLCGGLANHGFETQSALPELFEDLAHSFAPSLVVATQYFDTLDDLDTPTLILSPEQVEATHSVEISRGMVLQVASKIRTMIRLHVVEQVAEFRHRDVVATGISPSESRVTQDDAAILFIGNPTPAFMRLQHALAGNDVNTIAAFSTFSAFDYLHERTFDAVVLNASETTEIAYTVCAAMRRNTRLFHTPAVLLTGMDVDLDIEEAYARGASELLPVNASSERMREQLQALNVARVRRRDAKLRLESCRNASLTDPNSDLFKSEFGQNHLNSLIEFQRQSGCPLSVVGIQVGAPKSAGDEQIAGALNQFSSMLRHCVRTEDLAVRHGSSSFYLALPNTPQSGARTVADRVAAISECTAYEGLDPREPFRLELTSQVVSSDGKNSGAELVKVALQQKASGSFATAS
jgi:two-component system cell cycle response regulator PopA